MKLSFVIPAWNEEKLIGKTIESVQVSAEKYNFEIIVADDASDDRTPEIARELGATVASCNNRQIGPTRNDGAKVATGEIFKFVDADTIVSEPTMFLAGEAGPEHIGITPLKGGGPPESAEPTVVNVDTSKMEEQNEKIIQLLVSRKDDAIEQARKQKGATLDAGKQR